MIGRCRRLSRLTTAFALLDIIGEGGDFVATYRQCRLSLYTRRAARARRARNYFSFEESFRDFLFTIFERWKAHIEALYAAA